MDLGSTKEAPELDRVMKVAMPQLNELMITTEGCNGDLAMPPMSGMAVALAAGFVLILETFKNDDKFGDRLTEFAVLSANMILRPAGYEMKKL